MTKWPAHLAERAAIFELQGQDGEPLKGPTRLPLLIEEDQYIAFDPRSFRVIEVGRVGVEETNNGVST
jgi:hypothetical protein